MIYLDHNASTPLAPEVIAAMQAALSDGFGNPSSPHWAGVPARALVETARADVAALLGCSADEIVFTSGGTESNNLALKGVFYASNPSNRPGPAHLISSAIEHPAINAPLRFFERLGARVTWLPVDSDGYVDPNDLRRAIGPDTILISLMHANNEIGSIQPIAECAAIARDAWGAVAYRCRAVGWQDPNPCRCAWRRSAQPGRSQVPGAQGCWRALRPSRPDPGAAAAWRRP